jgi:ABC-type polysaccharide/polyol phosphate transport system ATPase subunit
MVHEPANWGGQQEFRLEGLDPVSTLRPGEIKIERLGKLYRYRSLAPESEGEESSGDSELDQFADDEGGGFSLWPRPLTELWALREVSCHIQPGDRVAVVGANGAGKSTLIRILSRTLPPSEGRVEGAGIVMPFAALRSPLSGHMSGCDNLRMIARLLGIPSQHLEDRLSAIIEFSELGFLAQEKVLRYSDGSFARLSMAMGLFIDADIYLVEDAIKVGDELYRVKFMDRLAEVLKREVTLVHASNNVDLLRKYCQRAIWLEGGRMRAFDDLNTVIRRFRSITENAEDFGDLMTAEQREQVARATLTVPGPRVSSAPKRLEPIVEWMEATARAENSWRKVLQRWREKVTPHDLGNTGTVEMADQCKLGTIRGLWCLNSESKPVRRALPGEQITVHLLVETFDPEVTVAIRLELDALLSVLVFVAEPLVPLVARDPGLYLFQAKIGGDLLAHSFESVLHKLRTRVMMQKPGGEPQMMAATVWFDLRGDVRSDFDEQRVAQGEPATSILRPTPAFVASPAEIEGSERAIQSNKLVTQWDKLNRRPAFRPRLDWMVYRAHETANEDHHEFRREHPVETTT